jgi:hypothetical protein
VERMHAWLRGSRRSTTLGGRNARRRETTGPV